MYVRKQKLYPFKPTSVGQGFASAEDLFAKKVHIGTEPELDEKAFRDSIRDAETGEAIDLSKASWNVVEGRVNLSTKSILAMGTGRLDIKTRIEQTLEIDSRTRIGSRQSSFRSSISGQDSRRSNLQTPVDTARTARTDGTDSDNLFFNSFKFKDSKQSSRRVLLAQRAVLPSIMDLQRPEPGFSPLVSPVGTAKCSARYSADSFRSTVSAREANSPLSIDLAVPQPTIASPSPHRRHPLITKLMKEGPLSPMHHIHWDARSNAVLTVDKDGEPLDLAEEGVDFSDSEGGASQEGADGSGQGQQQQQQGEGRLVRSNSVVSGLASVSSSSSVGSLSRSVGGGGRIKAKDRSNKRGSEHSVGRKENGGSSNNSVASSSHHSAASSTTHRGDTTIGQVNPSIVVTNRKHWQGVEERLFQEVYSLGWQYEQNKSLTGEEPMQGGLAAVRQTARRIARMKVKAMKELVQACVDEKRKEEKRAALEAENSNKLKYLLELMKVHDEERKKSRRYLHALEQDSEIVLIRSLNDIGWLW